MARLSKVLTGTAMVTALAAAGAAQAYTNPPFTAPGVPVSGYPAFVSGVLDAQLQSVSIGWNANADGHHDGAYQLIISAKASNVGVFNFSGGSYTVGNESVTLTANFDSTGHLLTNGYFSNTYQISGSLAASTKPSYGTAPSGFSWAAQPVETLFSEKLTGFGVDSKDDALGFDTGGFGGWANQKQFTGSSTAESLWLYALISTGHLYCVAPRPGNNCNASPSQTGVLPFTTGNTAWNNFLKQLVNHTTLSNATFYGIGEISTVPVPASVWLLGSGLLGLFAIRRRKVVSADKAGFVAA